MPGLLFSVVCFASVQVSPDSNKQVAGLLRGAGFEGADGTLTVARHSLACVLCLLTLVALLLLLLLLLPSVSPVAKMVCTAKHESGYRCNAIGRTNSDGTQDFGASSLVRECMSAHISGHALSTLHTHQVCFK